MGKKGISKYNGVFYVGQKISDWEIVSPDIIVDHESKVFCRCKCGVEKYVSAYSLLHGSSSSCPTCSSDKKKGKQNPSWKGFGDIPASYYRTAVSMEERISLAKTWEKSNKKCALTGWPISIEDKTASPDRIDSNKGYTEDNIQWVHKMVNICKNLFDNEHFITMCHYVAKTHENPEVYESHNVFGTTNKN